MSKLLVIFCLGLRKLRRKITDVAGAFYVRFIQIHKCPRKIALVFTAANDLTQIKFWVIQCD